MAAIATTMVLASCTSKGGDNALTNPGPTTTAEPPAAPAGAGSGLGESDTQEAAGPDTTAPQDSIPRLSQSESASQYLDDQWHDVANREGPDPSPASGDAADCIELSDVPFTPRTLVGDPIDDLSSGLTPSVYGTLSPLDEVITFQTFEDYPDPSTPTDLYGLIEAWTAAGFDGGVAAKRQNGSNLVMATVVKFASPESARSAVAAHIRDLCHRSVQSSRHDDGAGMTLLRDSGSVRSIRAIGPYEISLYACSCIADADGDRLDALTDWQDAVDGVWSAPDPDQTSGTNRL